MLSEPPGAVKQAAPDDAQRDAGWVSGGMQTRGLPGAGEPGRMATGSALLTLGEHVVLQLEGGVEVVFPDFQGNAPDQILALEHAEVGAVGELGDRQALG